MLESLPPEQIEQRSMEIIESEVPEPRPYVGGQWLVVRRLIHTSADFELLKLVRFHPRAVDAGVEALLSGCAIVSDTEMARAGMPVRRLDPLGCTTHCYMRDARVGQAAKERNSTRARVAVDLAVEELQPAVFVIGNAPTALLRLLELLEQGAVHPALVVGMPVGFVNAAESKELLIKHCPVPYIAIQGRKGGSALAAATLNALADMALQRKEASGVRS